MLQRISSVKVTNDGGVNISNSYLLLYVHLRIYRLYLFMTGYPTIYPSVLYKKFTAGWTLENESEEKKHANTSSL